MIASAVSKLISMYIEDEIETEEDLAEMIYFNIKDKLPKELQK